MAAPTPGMFDFINAVTGSDARGTEKNNLLLDTDEAGRKAFDPFMVRRGLAQGMDTVVCAEMMNLLHAVSPWMQWNYAFHSIPARKRYNKWSKKGEIDPNLTLVSQYYQISMEKAADYLRFLTPDQLSQLKTAVENQNNDKPKKAK